ncbi:MAG: chemotaxis protein CheC [Methanocalculus sp.]|uniref:chemotaxis protein CheC n=1 Tax=Methanocalculus sp. TaxID=2004547 RepID=UPI00271FDD1A|nr:chemotaxis protein CheC [Methanocalculus sp.]MDO9539282.1 chemotaxis protein CheC [Methanocalculus sp.]
MKIDPKEIDAIRELVNIGVGKAAGILSEMTGSTIELQIPIVHLYSEEEFHQIESSLGGERYAAVTLNFEGAFSGVTFSIFPAKSADILIAAITGDEPDFSDKILHLNAIHAETLKEVGNILINGVMGSITNVLGKQLLYSLPTYSEGEIPALIESVRSEHREAIFIAETRMFIRSLDIEGKILLIMGSNSLEGLIARVREISEQ